MWVENMENKDKIGDFDNVMTSRRFKTRACLAGTHKNFNLLGKTMFASTLRKT